MSSPLDISINCLQVPMWSASDISSSSRELYSPTEYTGFYRCNRIDNYCDRDLWVLFSEFQNRSDDQFFASFFCSPAVRDWRRKGSRFVEGPGESGPQLKTPAYVGISGAAVECA